MVFQQVVPPALDRKILDFLHSDLTIAHLGVTKTLEKVRSRFYWPGYKRWSVCCQLLCLSETQQSHKETYTRSTGMEAQFSFLNGRYWLLRPPSAGNQNIVLIGGLLSKWHEAIALPDQSTLTTNKVLMDLWITRLGCPESLQCDQGRNFEAKLFTRLTKLLQLVTTRTTAFHSQSNAVIERTDRTLLNMVAKRTDKNQRNWSEMLPYVMLAYRNLSTSQQATRVFSYFSAMKWPYQ